MRFYTGNIMCVLLFASVLGSGQRTSGKCRSLQEYLKEKIYLVFNYEIKIYTPYERNV